MLQKADVTRMEKTGAQTVGARGLGHPTDAVLFLPSTLTP